MNLKLWNQHPHWQAAEKAWEEGARVAEIEHPIKRLSVLPEMPGITKETAHNLKWKSLKWMVAKDTNRAILKGILKHPFRYIWNYCRSLFKTKSYKRDRDFFLYGINSDREFKKLLQDPRSLFVIGFSYCHKPFECPSGRFTPNCKYEATNPVCRQCFIGKCANACPEDVKLLFIPTIHYVGEKIFEISHQNPDRNLLFLITACEMTLQMFGDFGNMVGAKGIGVRLGGRICNTMKAFELSEEGIKPGLTVVLDDTQRRMLDLIRCFRESKNLN